MGYILDESGDPILDESGESISDNQSETDIQGLINIIIESTITSVNEKSSKPLTVSFVDSAGVEHAMSDITSVNWQLSDMDGTVINNRTFGNGVLTENPILLKDSDLALTNSGICRILAVSIVYDSDLGDGLTGTEEETFKINNLVNIS